jgi:hypothetical protein
VGWRRFYCSWPRGVSPLLLLPRHLPLVGLLRNSVVGFFFPGAVRFVGFVFFGFFGFGRFGGFGFGFGEGFESWVEFERREFTL